MAFTVAAVPTAMKAGVATVPCAVVIVPVRAAPSGPHGRQMLRREPRARLGVQRGQLRTMISMEAALLSLIGGVLGVLLGLGYGTVAAYTVLGDREMVYSVPWAMLAALVAIGLLGGLVASVLPAIRAGRITPVEALGAV